MPFDPLELYIPSNPFYAAANAIVPAIVAFSMALGVALIPVNNKDGLLEALANIGDLLMKIASAVTKFAPFGLFAIAASAVGTLQLDELTRLQVYFFGYLTSWLVLTFWTLPALVAWATPCSFREAMNVARVPMVTAFATGSVLVVPAPGPSDDSIGRKGQCQTPGRQVRAVVQEPAGASLRRAHGRERRDIRPLHE